MAVTAGVSAAAIAGYIAAAAAVAGAAVAAYGTYQAGQAASAAAKFNKQVAENNALAARQQAEVEARNRERRYRHIMGTQRASIGASGVIESEGSPLLVQMYSADQAALDAARVRYAGAIGATSYGSEAAIQGFYAPRARAAGSVGAGTSLLQGVASAASIIAQQPATGGYSSGAPYYGYTP